MFSFIRKMKKGLKELEGNGMRSEKSQSVRRYLLLVLLISLAGFVVFFSVFFHEWSKFNKGRNDGTVLQIGKASIQTAYNSAGIGIQAMPQGDLQGDSSSEFVTCGLSSISLMNFALMESGEKIRDQDSDQGNCDTYDQIARIRGEIEWQNRLLGFMAGLLTFLVLIKSWLDSFL